MTARRRVDIAVGERLREQRLKRGLSVRQLAAAVGVTAERISDYEAGRGRVTAAVLYELAVTLAVPISYFFADLRPEASDELPKPSVPC